MDNPTPAKINELILIDGAAGLMIPPKGEQLNRILGNENLVRHHYDDAGKPEAFSVTMPETGVIRHFRVLHSVEKPENGFRAIAYQEVDSPDGGNPIIRDGEPTIYLNFQGTKGTRGEIPTLGKIAARKPTAHLDDLNHFLQEMANQAEMTENLPEIMIGGHSYGATNAVASYYLLTGKEVAAPSVRLFLTEPAGSHPIARQMHGGKGRWQDEPDPALSEASVSVVSGPTRTGVTRVAGGTIGETYALPTFDTGFTAEEKATRRGSFTSRILDAHATDRLMKAVYEGAQPQYIGRDLARNAIEK